ncbi:signal peptide peptidase SppA [Hyphomonas sp. WL0036]|uniref:signal peptide peptidase SppA n=1 Tax=Hyphomonas sediminis TaxID=2866160 RepID=UPI001C7FD0E3|nr:signal peptide peptidase SppA [Hyphomonas sediminis]MBY9066876.1 signal peptide peptidase SppA [Hyphomonas sediminis]
MKTFLLSMAGAFTAMILFIFVSFVGLMLLIMAAAGSKPPHPANIVLTMDLNAQYPDQAPATGLAALSGAPGFVDLLVKLKSAESDKSVKGIYLRGADYGFGTSRAEELREALKSFQASGKFVIAHSQGMFGASGPSAYHSISTADEIWMQPGTDLMVTGVTFETEFLKGLFDKIDLQPQIYPFYEYKNAPNSYNETGYTEPHREAMEALANSIWSTALDEIAEDRDIGAGQLRTILESGPKPAAEALELKLVDKLGWPEDAEEAAKERGGGDKAELIDLASYVSPAKYNSKAPLIAVVGGEGAIVTGGGGSDSPFSSPPGFASDVVARAILDAAEDEDVKAIVFRVDSPGGSPTASDQIWRAVERAKEAGKPVVVSMGSMAASGGYYVSTGADAIMANRATLTGSIGIFGGKMALDGTFNKIGVTFDTVSVGGEFASAWGTGAFTPSQEAEVKASLKRGYDRFLQLVGEGRGMTYDQVHEVARGRVWTGEDALKVGLVDEIGTFMDAIEKAKSLAGIEADVTPRLAFYPYRKSGFEALEDVFGVSAETARAMSALSAMVGDERTQTLLEELSAVDAMNSGQAMAVGPRIRER